MAEPLTLAAVGLIVLKEVWSFTAGYCCNKLSDRRFGFGDYNNRDVPRCMGRAWQRALTRVCDNYTKSPGHELSPKHGEAIRSLTKSLSTEAYANRLFLTPESQALTLGTDPTSAFKPESMRNAGRALTDAIKDEAAKDPTARGLPDSFYELIADTLPDAIAYYFVEIAIKDDEKARAQIMWEVARASSGKLDAFVEETAKTNTLLAELLREQRDARRENIEQHALSQTGIAELLRFAKEKDEDRKRRYEAELRPKIEAEIAARGVTQSAAQAEQLAGSVIEAAAAPGFAARAETEGAPLAVFDALEASAERNVAGAVEGFVEAARWAIVIGATSRAARCLDRGLSIDPNHVWSLILRARVAGNLEGMVEADRYAGRALQSAEAASDAKGTAAALAQVGESLQARGDLPGALLAFRRYLHHSAKLFRSDRTNPLWREYIAIARVDIGDILRDQGKLADAERRYVAAVTSFRRLVVMSNHATSSVRRLAGALSRLGDIANIGGNSELALSRWAETESIFREVRRIDHQATASTRDLMIVLGRMADAANRLDRHVFALMKAVEATELARALTGLDPLNHRWQADLATNLDRLGSTCLDLGQLRFAAEQTVAALQIRHQLAAQDCSNHDRLFHLAVSHYSVARCLVHYDPPKTLTHLAEAHRLAVLLVGRDATNAKWTGLLDLLNSLVKR